ncbi:MAG TPA: DUF4202 family protein, partial [Polyangiaceae bacterium]|nr:DUF4202 family protein [Polyangiaceae bacterium]
RHTCAHRVDELLSICRELGLNTQVASGALEPESTRAPVEVARANLRVALDLGIQVRPAECAVGLRLVLPSDPRRQARISRVLAEFPAIRVEFIPFDAPVDPALTLEVFEWARRDCDLAECDRIAAHAADSSAWLSLRGADLPEDVLFQVLTRYQRLLTRTDVACCDPLFARVLERHRALHDLSKPLVRADFDHAIDVWLWLLRIEPGASRALQWAALFHDIERLESEADFRIEQHAPDYQAFKDAHAEQGARMTRAVLTAAGVTPEEADQVAQWIVWHERPAHEDRSYDSSALADADALSFFSLNSPGFMNYYGLEHTQKKIAYSLSRMSPRAKKLLTRVKLRADVQDALLRTYPGGAAAKAAELAANFESSFETEPTLNQ